MKLNDLISEFTIYMSNEEQGIFDRLEKVSAPEQFSQREQRIIESMIKKSLISKVNYKGNCYLVRNHELNS